MIRLSQRFVPAVCALLLLGAVATLYHFWVRPETTHCRNGRALVEERFLPSISEFATVARNKDIMLDGSAGRVALPGRWNLRPHYRIARSYDLENYFFLPADNFTNMFPEDESGIEWVEHEGTRLPIHVRLDESERESVITTWLYIMDGRPIRHPLGGSLGLWLEQLRSGRRPLTMILLNGRTPFAHMERQRDEMIEWMRAAWSRYDALCNS